MRNKFIDIYKIRFEIRLFKNIYYYKTQKNCILQTFLIIHSITKNVYYFSYLLKNKTSMSIYYGYVSIFYYKCSHSKHIAYIFICLTYIHKYFLCYVALIQITYFSHFKMLC